MADTAVVTAIKLYLGCTGTDDDTLIGSLIDSVDAIIEAYVDWEIMSGQAAYTEYHDGKGEEALVLKRWPVDSVSTLHDDLENDYGDSTLISSDDYTIDLVTGILRLYSGYIFANGHDNVKVVYTAGFDSVPDDVAQVRREETARIYHRAKQGGDGMKTERQGPYDVTYDLEDMSKRSKLILAKYRTSVRVAS